MHRVSAYLHTGRLFTYPGVLPSFLGPSADDPGEAVNDCGDVGGWRTCSSVGERHRDGSTRYAADVELDMDSGANPERVETALENLVLETAESIGLCQWNGGRGEALRV